MFKRLSGRKVVGRGGDGSQSLHCVICLWPRKDLGLNLEENMIC